MRRNQSARSVPELEITPCLELLLGGHLVVQECGAFVCVASQQHRDARAAVHFPFLQHLYWRLWQEVAIYDWAPLGFVDVLFVRQVLAGRVAVVSVRHIEQRPGGLRQEAGGCVPCLIASNSPADIVVDVLRITPRSVPAPGGMYAS